MVQLSFIETNNLVEECLYNNQIEFIYKELKEALFKRELKYNANKKELKDWYLNKFFNREDLEEITIKDLIYIAEEKCNIILN